MLRTCGRKLGLGGQAPSFILAGDLVVLYRFLQDSSALAPPRRCPVRLTCNWQASAGFGSKTRVNARNPLKNLDEPLKWKCVYLA
jgi:hypothetical protein